MSTLGNLKNTYERAKSKMFAKGDGDVDDAEYFSEKEKVLFLEQTMLRLNKRSKKSLELFAEMSKLQNEIVTDMSSMYPADDRMHTTVALLKEASNNAETNRVKMAERIERNSLRPVDEYCASFREIKRRMDDYSVRRSDMERHRTDLEKLKEKGPIGAPKVPQAEEKYKIALQRYEELREELLKDLPALNADRDTILGFILSCQLKSQAEFYTDLAEKYSVINSLVASIDERAVFNHPKVVTPQERTAAATNLRAHPVFIKGDAQKAGGSQIPPPTQQTTTRPPQPQPQPQPQAQPLIHTPYTMQKQQAPDHSVYSAEVGSITMMPPSAPLSETSTAPSKPIKAQGLYDFVASEDNELSFQKGDILTIVAKHGDWWEAEMNGTSGLLPSNYVKEL